MHRHRTLARFSLILSILNLVLAAPIAVQKLHEARLGEMVVAEDLASMLKKWRGVEAGSDRSVLPRLPPDDPEASPPHSTSADEPTAPTDSLDSGHVGSLPLGPNPNPNPTSLHGSSIPHFSISGLFPDIPSSSRGPVFLYFMNSASSDSSQELEPEHMPHWSPDSSPGSPTRFPEWVEQTRADSRPYVPLRSAEWWQRLEAEPTPWELIRASRLGPPLPRPERLPEFAPAPPLEFAPAPPFPPLRDPSETSSRHSSSASSEILEVSHAEQSQESAHPPAPPAQPHLALEPLPPSPGASSSGSSETTEIRLPERLQEFAGTPPAPTPPAPPLPAGSASRLELARPGSLEIPEMPLATWLQEFASAPERRPIPQLMGSDQVATEAHLPPDQFAPVPSHYLTQDGPPPSHSSPPTETPPDDQNFFNKEMMKKIGIPVAAAIVGSAMITAGVVGLEHHNHQDK